MSPRVSVVLPVFNARTYLREAVESILGQTLEDLELVAVDDGSTDGSREILEGYAAEDCRIRLLRNPSNLGLIPSLNRGVEAARGRYVARQDGDDVSLPGRLAQQADWLDAHPKVGILATDYWRLYPDGSRSLRRPPRGHTELRFRLLFGNVWCHPSIMLRREVLEHLEGSPFRADFLYVEDYELWTRLLRRTRGATLPEPLVLYRVHDEGVCGSNAPQQALNTWRVAAREMDRLVPGLGITPQRAEELALARRDPGPRASTAQTTRGMLELFDALAGEPDIDRSVLRGLRRRWIGRLVATHPARRLPQLGKAADRALVRRAPLALLLALLAHPYRRLRSMAHRQARSLRRRGTGAWLRHLLDRVRQRTVRAFDSGRPRRWRVEVEGRALLAQPYAGFTVLFTPGVSLLQRLRRSGDLYEPELVVALRREIGRRRATRFLDVGANVGLMTLAVLQAYPDLRVDAFEPSPHPADLLAATLRHNQLDDRVRLHRFALAEAEGRADFWTHHPAHASGDGLRDTGRAGEAERIEVATRTLDSWWKEAGEPPVPVVKIDTEGAELPILRGATELLETCRPTLFLEIHERNLRAYAQTAADVHGWLTDRGYRLWSLDGRRVEAEHLGSLLELGETFVGRCTEGLAPPAGPDEGQEP